MLIDLHSHTSGISWCCRVPAPEIVKTAKDACLDGIVLTNHYQSCYVGDGDFDAFAKRYIEEYEYTKKCGEEIGCRVFFGIEATLEKHGCAHMLIYGVDTTFVTEHPMMFGYSQEELYEKVKEAGGILIQAHPLRGGKNALLDTTLMDGIEINSHQLYDGTHLDELSRLAEREGLILTSGGDYHADTRRPHCGTFLPDHISDGVELGKYIASASSLELCYQEPWEDESRRTTFYRRKKK